MIYGFDNYFKIIFDLSILINYLISKNSLNEKGK